MTALIILSLVYAGVLMVVLAASLTAIWISLRRTGRLLAEVSRSLATASSEAAALKPHLERLAECCTDCAEELTKAEEALAGADERLRAIVQPTDQVGTSSG